MLNVRLIYLCSILFFSLPLSAKEGPTPVVNMELIADDSAIFSVNNSKLVDFLSAPVVYGEHVFFVAKNDKEELGIYKSTHGKIALLIDSNYMIPDGSGNFTSFVGSPMGSDDALVFRAKGADSQEGIYLLQNNIVKKVADTKTVMPNSEQQFVSFKRPVFDGKAIVFVGRGTHPTNPAQSKYQGAYYYSLEEEELKVVADWKTKIPDSTNRFGVMDDITVSRGLAILTAADANGNTGIYSYDQGVLTTLIDSKANINQRKLVGFNDGVVDRSFQTNNFVFKNETKDKLQSSVNAWIDGKLETIADNKAAMAGGSDNFQLFSKPNMYGKRIYFIGKGKHTPASLYAWQNGKRFPIVHRDILLGGRKVVQLNMSLESAAPNGLAFHASFEDGKKAIYFAHLRDKAGKVILSDNLHGNSKGVVSGGKFIDGGGWTLLNDNDRIVWNIPPMSAHGLLEVDIRNFDPKNQLTAAKNIFLGLWGTLFQNHERLNQPETDNWEIRVGKAHEQFKVEYHARGFGKAADWVPFDKPFDPNHIYRFRVEWHDGKVTTWVDDKVLHFEGLNYEPVDKFNYLHIGTSSHFGGTGTVGPIYSNVRIVSFD